MIMRKIYRVFAVPLFQDNYSYLIQGTKQKQLVLVDPANPNVILSFINKYFPHYSVSNILYTHKHWDHAGGQNDKAEVPAANKFLKGGQILQIGQNHVKSYFVPCHTRGHIVYHFLPKQKKGEVQKLDFLKMETIQGKSVNYFQTQQCAFTGDTLFSAGIGRFFQGNAQQMVRNIQLLTSNIKDDVSIFNGHEYALTNLKWAVHVEKQNKQLKSYYQYLSKQAEQKGQNNLCTLPTNFKRQKQINLFVRSVTGTYLHEKVTKDKIKLMSLLRQMKNSNNTQFSEL